MTARRRASIDGRSAHPRRRALRRPSCPGCRRSVGPALVAWLACTVSTGCADGGGTREGPQAPSEPPALPGVIRYAPCVAPDGAADEPPPEDVVVDCGTATVPLDWSNPAPRDADLIQVVFRRYRAPDTPEEPDPDGSGSDVWVLPGGPRPAAEVGLADARAILGWDPAARVFVPDPRGSASSSPLGCAEEENEFSDRGQSITFGELEGCAGSLLDQWGDERFLRFRFSGAVDDLASLVGATRSPGRRVQMVARSFGAWWATRLLGRYPTVVDGALLLAVPRPPRGVLLGLDSDIDGVGRRFLERCGEDGFCRDRLGPDPVDRAEALLLGPAPAADCVALGPDGDSPATLRALFADLLLPRRELRPLIPAVLARFDRCSPEDRAALEAFDLAVADAWAPRPPDVTIGTLFEKTLFLAEGFPAGQVPTVAELSAARRGHLFTADVELGFARIAGTWPSAPDADAPPPEPTGFEIPVWVFHGELDASAPFSRVAAWVEQIPGDVSPRLFAVPDGTHALDGQDDAGRSCAEVATEAFLVDDRDVAEVERCLAGIPPIPFRGSPALAETWFGTNDLYD